MNNGYLRLNTLSSTLLQLFSNIITKVYSIFNKFKLIIWKSFHIHNFLGILIFLNKFNKQWVMKSKPLKCFVTTLQTLN